MSNVKIILVTVILYSLVVLGFAVAGGAFNSPTVVPTHEVPANDPKF